MNYYVIKVIDIENPFLGKYFRKCYLYGQDGERAIYIGVCNEIERAKRYKTKQTAENCIKNLKQKQAENMYIRNYIFEIVEVKENNQA